MRKAIQKKLLYIYIYQQKMLFEIISEGFQIKNTNYIKQLFWKLQDKYE